MLSTILATNSGNPEATGKLEKRCMYFIEKSRTIHDIINKPKGVGAIFGAPLCPFMWYVPFFVGGGVRRQREQELSP